jgi:hypothetical protein
MDRVLLFVWAAAATGFTIAGLSNFPENPRTGWLYLVAAIFMGLAVWVSWRRLVAARRDRSGAAETRGPDA